METKVLLRLIKDDINLLDEINRSFMSDEKLSPDEVEVALTRARSLVMEFEMLSRNVAQEHEIIIKAEDHVKSRVHDKVVTIQKEEDLPDKDSELIDLEEEEVLKPKMEPADQKNAVEETFVVAKTITQEKAEKVTKPEKQAKVLIQGALFEEAEQMDGKTLGEILGDKHQLVHDLLVTESNERNFEEIPLKSIREGIGINDRFLFMRELFGNEAEKYEQTITALDGFIQIEEAVSYLKQNFKWNKTEAGQKFLALVKRRFTK